MTNKAYHARVFGRSDKAKIWAHRGASHDAPENTIAAFRLAVEQGAEGIECDVRLCKTGEVVLLHDEKLNRLTGLPVAARDLPLSVLREQRVLEAQFPQYEETVPTLEEGILSTPSETLWNIELKVSRHREAEPLARAVVDLVRRMEIEERVLLSSFHPLALLTIRKIARDLATAYLWEPDGPYPALWHAFWKWPTASCAVHPHLRFVTEGAVRRWRRQGFCVNAWVADEREEIQRLERAAVDGIVTNRPAFTRRILEG